MMTPSRKSVQSITARALRKCTQFYVDGSTRGVHRKSTLLCVGILVQSRGIMITILSWSRRANVFDWNPRPKTEAIDPEYIPEIWDNVPLDGFEIVDTVRQYGGNKLFRVKDPRGVEFEIKAECLFEILSDGTISKGKILDKCIWLGNKRLQVVK